LTVVHIINIAGYRCKKAGAGVSLSYISISHVNKCSRCGMRSGAEVKGIKIEKTKNGTIMRIEDLKM
jgi:hypothetical protein